MGNDSGTGSDVRDAGAAGEDGSGGLGRRAKLYARLYAAMRNRSCAGR